MTIKAIALRRFFVCPIGSTTAVDYAPGDVIHDFRFWPEDNKRALVGAGSVRVVELSATAEPTPLDLACGSATDVAHALAAVSGAAPLPDRPTAPADAGLREPDARDTAIVVENDAALAHLVGTPPAPVAVTPQAATAAPKASSPAKRRSRPVKPRPAPSV